jgi:CRISPR system Cascade subunit CasD
MVEAYRFAVRVDRQGTLIRDFHTWQRPKTKQGAKWKTRKEELEAEELETGLSRRDYCCDASYVVCMWTVVDDAPFSLEQIQSCVACPRFVLYLGRKSCPPALPLGVHILQADSVLEAFDKADQQASNSFLSDITKEPRLFFWDDSPHVGDIQAQDTFTRRDVPLNRQAWQFTERREHFGRRLGEEGA